jgi:PcaR/PcaU/PobR family beta-ketoadipate pathway transcriptional regulator
MDKKNNRNYVDSIAKGMKVLSFIVNCNKSAGITQISKALDLSIGAVQRVTNTLQTLGYLRKDKNSRGYILGYKSWGLGLAIIKDIDLKYIAYPYLEELSRDIGETVNLAILEDTEIVYVDRIKTEQILNINLNIGSKLPAYCASMGKSLLAFLPEDELLNILDTMNMKPITPNTITDKAKLLEELEQVRQKGFSINNSELDIGLRSVAAPVRDESGRVVAAVNIAVPSSRVTFEDLTTRLAKKVVGVAKIISEALGYKEHPQAF